MTSYAPCATALPASSADTAPAANQIHGTPFERPAAAARGAAATHLRHDLTTGFVRDADTSAA